MKLIRICILLILFLNQSCTLFDSSEPQAFGDDKGLNVFGFIYNDLLIQQWYHNKGALSFNKLSAGGTYYYFSYTDGDWSAYTPEKAMNDTLCINSRFRYYIKSMTVNVPMLDIVQGQPTTLDPENVFMEADVFCFAHKEMYEEWEGFPRLVVEEFSITFDTIDYDNAIFKGSFYMRFQFPFETDDDELEWKEWGSGSKEPYYKPLDVPDIFETTDGHFALYKKQPKGYIM